MNFHKSPYDLAVIRILVTLLALNYTVWENVAGLASLPPGIRLDRGISYLIPDALVQSADALALYHLATGIFIVLALVGLATRFTLPAAALLYIGLHALLGSYSQFYHFGVTTFWVMLALSFTPCAEALSLDAWRKRRPPRAPGPVFTEAWRFVITPMVLLYLLAGLSKVRASPMWWVADNMRGFVAADALVPYMAGSSRWALDLVQSMPDAFFALMGLYTLVIELGYSAVLFSRRARWVFPVGAALLHLGIFFLQNILFFDLIVLQLAFFNWDWFIRRLRGDPVEQAAPTPAPPA